MAIREINFDGIIGPSHNYAGLSLGNLASTSPSARLARILSTPCNAAARGRDTSPQWLVEARLPRLSPA